MNKPNAAFLLVVAMMGFSAMIFTVQTLVQGWRYYQLDSQVPLKALAIAPKPLAHDKYALLANYSYLTYVKEEVLDNPTYKNVYAAEDAAEQKMSRLRKVWINSSHPSQSSLEKQISYKQIAYTLVLWGLTAYFLLLNYIKGKN